MYLFYFSSYDIHQKKLMVMQEELELKRLIGVRADPTYQTMRQMIMNNRMRTHEFAENSK